MTARSVRPQPRLTPATHQQCMRRARHAEDTRRRSRPVRSPARPRPPVARLRGHPDVQPHRRRDPRRPGHVHPVHVRHRAPARARSRDQLLGEPGPEDRGPRRVGRRTAPRETGSHRPIDWLGRLDGFAQSVDQRVKMAGWMETFAQRGGQLVIHGAAVSDLDYFAAATTWCSSRPARASSSRCSAGTPRVPRTTLRSARWPSRTCTAWGRAPSTRIDASAATWSPAWASSSSCRPSPPPAAPTSCSGRASRAARSTPSRASRTPTSTWPTLELMETYAVGVRARHGCRAHRRQRHARRPLRADRPQAHRPAALRRAGPRRRRRRRPQRPDHRPGVQLRLQVRGLLPGHHPRARRPAVRRRVDAGHLRPLLGQRTARHEVDQRDAGAPPEHVLDLFGAAGSSSRSPTASPTASTTRRTSRTSSSSPEKTNAYLGSSPG